ncbi:MAG: peptidylprolyl isomerase [Ruminococcaceae bacterium]|nr:peptidylprolyl isomerase [Oscillospiraceae bacterium]
MKKFLALLIALTLVCALAAGCGTPKLTGTHIVDIVVKDYGTITVELNGDAAPITVGNFVDLAKNGFYDGLTFHRIMEGFMMQGGDPEGTGMGGSDRTIKGEFLANGVANPISHTRGTISMARNSISMDSASSQFFIMHEDDTRLDGQYAAFGHVIEGIEVVDAICKAAKPYDMNGSIRPENQPVIESITVRETGTAS